MRSRAAFSALRPPGGLCSTVANGRSRSSDCPGSRRGASLHAKESRFESGRLLVQADDVSRRVAEPCRNFRRVGANRLDDLTAIRDNRVERRGDVVDHDVNQKTWLRRRGASTYPRSAHLPDSVVKGGPSVTALPDGPGKDLFVEIGGACDVSGGHLDIADLPVCQRRRHKG